MTRRRFLQRRADQIEATRAAIVVGPQALKPSPAVAVPLAVSVWARSPIGVVHHIEAGAYSWESACGRYNPDHSTQLDLAPDDVERCDACMRIQGRVRDIDEAQAIRDRIRWKAKRQEMRRQKVIAYAEANPGATHQEVADCCGTIKRAVINIMHSHRRRLKNQTEQSEVAP